MIEDHGMPYPVRNVELPKEHNPASMMKEVNEHAVNQFLTAACLYTFGLWVLFIATLFILSKWF